MTAVELIGRIGTFYPHGLEDTPVVAKIERVVMDEEGERWFRVTVATSIHAKKYPYIKEGEEYWCYARSFRVSEAS